MKDLHNGNLYWPATGGNYSVYPPLQMDARYRVAIIGGGISGLLCGYVLARNGINAVVLERGDIAGGSTSANTGLLQFCNDIMLTDLIGQIGEADAVLFYKSCLKAIDHLEEICGQLGDSDLLERKSSLYYASSAEEVPKLRREYEALLAHGFPVEYWEPETIERHFPFRKPGAIVTHGDAVLNPFRFVHMLAEAASARGLVIHEGTNIIGHTSNDFGLHRLTTASGAAIEADHVVYAVGYEPEELRGQLIKADINRTYAIVTEPQKDLAPWYGEYLIWETARPYLYLRTTADGRVIVGGLDEDNPEPLHNERQRHARTDKLHRKLKELFPSFTAPVAYDWTASFGESRDNLPFIGKDPAWPGVYYCLGYGGSGSVYSMLASCLFLDLIRGDDNPLASIIKLDRATLLNKV